MINITLDLVISQTTLPTFPSIASSPVRPAPHPRSSAFAAINVNKLVSGRQYLRTRHRPIPLWSPSLPPTSPITASGHTRRRSLPMVSASIKGKRIRIWLLVSNYFWVFFQKKLSRGRPQFYADCRSSIVD